MLISSKASKALDTAMVIYLDKEFLQFFLRNKKKSDYSVYFSNKTNNILKNNILTCNRH